MVVQELVKHLLYMRNQIPGLFEDLEWQTQASYTSLTCTPIQDLYTRLPVCSVQAQEQEKQLQDNNARLALLEHAGQRGPVCHRLR